MTRLHDVSTGKFDQFKRELASAGLDGEMIDAVLRQPNLANGMVDWLCKRLNRPSSGTSKLFCPLRAQLNNVWRWNAVRSWGFTREDFDAIDLTPSGDEDLDLVVDVIVPYLPDNGSQSGVQRTFEELRLVSGSVHPYLLRSDRLRSDPKHLKLLVGIEHRPGIRRVKLDLAANWDRQYPFLALHVRSENLAHAEVLAAAAHFPEWVRAMDGRLVPYVLMRGYMTTAVGLPWGDVPMINWLSLSSAMEITTYGEWFTRGPITGTVASPELLQA